MSRKPLVSNANGNGWVANQWLVMLMDGGKPMVMGGKPMVTSVKQW